MTRLRISPDGRIRSVWDDDVQLGELGVIRVRRASHVEFDDRRQCWTVREAAPRNKRLREVMYSDYAERQPRCPICRHVAHLKFSDSFPADDIPF